MKFLSNIYWFYKILFLILILFIFYFLFFSKGSWLEHHVLKKENQRIQGKIGSIREEILFLKKKEARLISDSGYVDRFIRSKLGMAKQDEKIFVLQTTR